MHGQILKRWTAPAALAAAATFGLVACEGGATGPDGTTTVTMSQADGATLSSSVLATSSRPVAGAVSLDAVSSIVVQVNRVQVHRAGDGDGGSEGDAGGWVDLNVEIQEIDLITDLSSTASLTIAEGDVAAGDYDQVRFFLDGATITFNSAQQIPGGGGTVTEGQLTIPSSGQTGIKVPGAGFTVEGEGSTSVDIEFDAGTSVQNVTITGTGEVIMAPVLVSGGSTS